MKSAAVFRVVALGALIGAACAPPAEGPGPIVWGRDVCEHCQMAISDRRNAVQIRSAHDHRLRSFDDLGCALLWQEAQPDAQRGIEELWVPGAGESGWQDGRVARYSDGHPTPMDHGFRALVEPSSVAGLSLEQVRVRVVEMERERRSARR